MKYLMSLILVLTIGMSQAVDAGWKDKVKSMTGIELTKEQAKEKDVLVDPTDDSYVKAQADLLAADAAKEAYRDEHGMYGSQTMLDYHRAKQALYDITGETESERDKHSREFWERKAEEERRADEIQSQNEAAYAARDKLEEDERLAKEQANLDRIAAKESAKAKYEKLYETLPETFDRAVKQCYTNGQELADLTTISLGGKIGSDVHAELVQSAQDACKCKYGNMVNQGFILSRDNDIMAQDMINVEKFLGRNQIKMQSPGNRIKQWEIQQDKLDLDDKLVYDMSYTANISGICEN